MTNFAARCGAALFLIVAVSQYAFAFLGAASDCRMVRRQSTGTVSERYGCAGDCVGGCEFFEGGSGAGTHEAECTCVGNQTTCKAKIKYTTDQYGNQSNIIEGCTVNSCTGPCETTPQTWSGENVCRCDAS